MFTELCKSYAIGKLLDRPQPLLGGLLHRVWRIQTTSGIYVVKALNSAVITKPESNLRYSITEEIARQMLAQVSAIAAIPLPTGQTLFTYKYHVCLLYPYVAGHIIKPSQIKLHHIQKISHALTHIHSTPLTIENIPPVETYILNLNHWLKNFDTLKTMYPSLTHTINAFATKLPELQRKIQIISQDLCTNLLVSHRDLDPKNILWDANEKYYLIDWESAGFINRTKDLIATAIYWSMNENFYINTHYYNEFIKAYMHIHAHKEYYNHFNVGIYGLLSDWLNWLEFNIQRVLKNHLKHPEHYLGITESQKTMRAIPILLKQISKLLY